MVLDMVMVYKYGQMEPSMRATGKITNNMVKVDSTILMVLSMMVYITQ